MEINFYKVTGAGWSKPAYYAGYSIEGVRHAAYADNNSQFVVTIEPVTLADSGDNLIRKASLNYNDAKAIAKINDYRIEKNMDQLFEKYSQGEESEIEPVGLLRSLGDHA